MRSSIGRVGDVMSVHLTLLDTSTASVLDRTVASAKTAQDVLAVAGRFVRDVLAKHVGAAGRR